MDSGRADTSDVERRRETRPQTDQPIEVTILVEPPVQCRGRVVDISGRGLRLELPLQIALGAAVRVDLCDSLLLGEVCHCGPAGDSFSVGIMLEESLTGLTELENLNRSLLAESGRGETTESERQAASVVRASVPPRNSA